MVVEIENGQPRGAPRLIFADPGRPTGMPVLDAGWGDLAVRRDGSMFAVAEWESVFDTSGRATYISDFPAHLERLLPRR